MEFTNSSQEKEERNQQEEEEEEDPQATSSIENVIPMKQLSHGWKVLQGFAKVSFFSSLSLLSLSYLLIHPPTHSFILFSIYT